MISSFKDSDTRELYETGENRRFASIAIRVPAPRVNAIVRGKRAISADTALRLGQFFRVEPQFWMNLQSNYDLAVAENGAWNTVKKFIPEFNLRAACL